MPQAAAKPHIFESGDRIFLVAPVTPIKPEASDIERFAFAEDLKKGAPNPHFLWLRGNYVEADNPNANGDEWTADELSIKSLTPMFCPVTVMHDPSTAVGLIADSALKVPSKDAVPRARIETTLAIWAHRFPDIADEVMHNYEAGSLMQSMECFAPTYNCGECGQMFHKLPGGAEESGWCEHLAENPNGRRTLSGVTFTGTGLIFGSRGARGAYSEAHLEPAVQAEIVEAHDKSHEKQTTSRTSQRRVIPMDKMEIERSEYDSLKARPSQDDLTAAEKRAEEAEDAKAQADKAVEEAEAAQKKAEKERDELQEKVEKAEETEAASKLSKERIEALGNDFLGALGEKTRERLDEQAGTHEDDEWEARLEELEELTELKRDASSEEEETDDKGGSKSKSGKSGELTREETAAARVGGRRSSTTSEPSEAKRASVIGGLTRKSGQPVGAGKDE